MSGLRSRSGGSAAQPAQSQGAKGDVGGPWPLDADIVSTAKPWPWHLGALGTVLGLGLLGAALPMLLAMALLLTFCEFLRSVFRLDSCEIVEGADDDVVLVMPGVCGYIFHQLGMVQYICEHFETSRLKLAGVSSGAIGAAMVLTLEEAAAEAATGKEASERVRKRVHEIYGVLDRHLAPHLWWPLGFLGRLGLAMDDIIKHVQPAELPAEGRLRVGARRAVWAPLPAAVPDATSSFLEMEDLIATLRASSSVWLIVRIKPLVWLRQKGASFMDGVNPFSLFCFLDYLRQWMSGESRRTAPPHTHSGGLDIIYNIWNCGVMRPLLPRRGTLVWVTPTVGGRLDVSQALRFSGWFMAEQWRRGYAHARDLDADAYFAALPRRVPGPGDERATGA